MKSLSTDNLQNGTKIWAKDIPWKVEKENDNTYEVFYGFVVTHFNKQQIIQHENGSYQYFGKSMIPEKPFEEVKSIIDLLYY